MNSMTQDVIKYGTGRKALKLEREDIAGKTGTTNDVRDSWFCGYQKDLVTIAWMGFDDFAPLGKGETGGQAGLGMWVDFMREALKDKPIAMLDVPDGMVEVRIDKRRGTPTKSTGSNTMVEWIREEYELMTLGPEPVRYAVGRKAAAPARARRTATAPTSAPISPSPTRIARAAAPGTPAGRIARPWTRTAAWRTATA